MLTYYASMLVVQTLRTTMMAAGPRTVGLGRFSPVQRLDERSEASSEIKMHVKNAKCW
jgi:hypothetical protein